MAQYGQVLSGTKRKAHQHPSPESASIPAKESCSGKDMQIADEMVEKGFVLMSPELRCKLKRLQPVANLPVFTSDGAVILLNSGIFLSVSSVLWCASATPTIRSCVVLPHMPLHGCPESLARSAPELQECSQPASLAPERLHCTAVLRRKAVKHGFGDGTSRPSGLLGSFVTLQ